MKYGIRVPSFEVVSSRELLLYAGLGLAAGLLHALVAPALTIPAIGASGAIGGVMGALMGTISGSWQPERLVTGNRS